MGKFSVSGLARGERRARSAASSPGRWYRRALQEYNPEDDDGGVGDEDEDEDDGQYGVPRDVRRRPAGIDEQQEEARLFNKKKKQQEERDARIRADLAARQEWLQKQKEEAASNAKPPAQHAAHAAHDTAPGHRHAKSHAKSHAKRSSGHRAVIEVAAAAQDDDEDDEDDEDDDEDDEDDEEEEVEEEEVDGAIPTDPIDLRADKVAGFNHRPPSSVNNAATVTEARPQGQGRHRPHAPEYGNIDDLLEPSKSSTHWGTYPSDERLLELDSKSSSPGSSKGSRGRRVRGLGRHAGHAAGVRGGSGGSGGHSGGRRVRRGFGYEGGLPGLASVDPCERDPAAATAGGASTGPGPAATGSMHLYMGCSTQDTMEFRRDCGAPEPDVLSAYTCHGRWEENGTHFLITSPLPRSSRPARRFCFVYREWPGQGGVAGQGRGGRGGLGLGGTLHFSSSGESCQRSLGLRAAPHAASPIAFNITSSGECMDTSAGTPSSRPASSCLVSGLTALVIFVALAGRR